MYSESRQKILTPGFKKAQKGQISGTRTRHVITFNPSVSRPSEEIYVQVPKLKPGTALVPDKMSLVFDFKNSNTKSWFDNNLSKCLQKRLEIKFAGEKVYDNSGESLMEVYKDLWLPEKTRTQKMEHGIMSDNQRKVVSKSDDATADKLASLYSKQKISLSKIIGDHGLYAPHSMANDLQFIITLPKSEEIMHAQSSQSTGEYSLENMELEYETIENPTLVSEIESGYNTGRALGFEHVTLFKTVNWAKDTTIVNENINLPRKSLRSIVMLFTKNTRAGSEEFVYPEITEVRVTKEGVPNCVYSQGIPKRRLYEEACRVFSQADSQMTPEEFYFGSQFALVVDLRSIEDNSLYGLGAKLASSQSGIMLEISKKVTTTDLKCHIFVLADGILKVQAGSYQGLSY